MAINPDDITTARVGQLPPASFSLTDLIPHEVGTVLSQGTIQSFADFLATYIDTTGAVAFRPVTVLDGQTLPDTTELEWILVGKGTFINVNGGADITTTQELNALMSNGTYWFIGVEIPIEVEGIGYTPESIANKISEITTYSEILYPNEKATHDALDLKLNISDLPTNLTLYPTTVASDISGYIKMVTSINDPDYDEPAVDVTTPEITTTAQLLSSRATVAGVLVGQPGVFNITSYGHIRRLSGTGTANFYFETYQRNAAGTETLICTSGNTLPVSSAVYSEFTASSVWNNGIFLATDRIVIKAYANRISGGTDPVYQIQFGGETPVRVVLPVPFSVVDAGYELKENKQNSLTADLTNIKYPTVTAVNGGLASKADKQGTILYHSVKWFTPYSSVSNVGATVTSIGTQFTSAMVGSILRINDEDRLILSYTSSTVVVVDVAYSANYSGVVAGSWGVYSKGFEIESDGKINVKNTGEDSAVLGTELLLNNSFNTDLSSWTVGANWSYSSGGALHTTGSVETLSQNVSLISGNTYLISVTMSGRTTGDLVFQLGTLNYAFSFNDSGRFNLTEYKTVVATATGSFPITLTPGTTFNGKVDEVSIKLVNLNTVDSTLNLLNKLDVLSSEIRANADLKNIFFGLNSGASNATGIENIAFGNGALKDNTTGYQNTALGYESMRDNTTGFSNTAYGYSSFLRNKNGSRNTAIGVYSMIENTIGKNNTALGTHSMQNSTTGSDNVAIGMSSMMIGINTGSYNTGINTFSLYRNTTGSYNISVGFQTLFNNTTGSNNIALGLQALNLNITGGSNIAIGSSSLISSTGVRNTAIGTDSGRSITTGTYNTHIGSTAGYDASQLVSATNSTSIGNGSYNTASNQVVIGNSSVTQTILRGNVETNGTISMSPATLSTQGVVKSQLSTQYEIGANSNVLDVWMDNEVIFTASCTITVPATLPTNFNFNWLTLAGVTVTWAITSPHTWLFGTPGNATEKTYGRMVKRNSTNSIIML